MGGRAKLPLHGDNHGPGGADPLKSWGASDGDVLMADGAGGTAWESAGGGIAVYFGSGTPEGAQTGNVGDVYVRSNGLTGTTVYEKTSGTGNTGWTARAILGGGIVETDLAFTDITTANASTTKHGLLPKLPNDATKFLDGTGAYAVPPSGGWDATIVKASDEAVVSSTTLQDDDELFFTPAADAWYEFTLAIVFTTTTNSGIAFEISQDANVRGVVARAVVSGATAILNINVVQQTLFNVSTGPTSLNGGLLQLWGWFMTGSGAQNALKFRWAQQTSVGSPGTKVKAGSVLRYRRIV